jgi:hypothetical protein
VGEADFVADEQVGPRDGVDDFTDGVVGEAAIEGFDEVGGSEVAELESGVHDGASAADEDAGLPVPGGPMIARLACARIHSRLARCSKVAWLIDEATGSAFFAAELDRPAQ